MRTCWKKDPVDTWLRLRHHVEPHPQPLPADWLTAPAGPGASEIGALVGTLIHRLFALGLNLVEALPEDLEPRLRAMAECLLETAFEDVDAEGAPAEPGLVRILVASAQTILARLRRTDAASREARELLSSPGQTEVPFVLSLGRWLVRGRFDKLIPAGAAGGFLIVDWKTDKEGATRERVEHHRRQMELYALALHRSGKATNADGSVEARLVFLESAQVSGASFRPAELEAFAADLARDLEKMEQLPDALRADSSQHQ